MTMVADAVAGAGAVDGGGDLGSFKPVEEHGQVGERVGQVGDVARPVERINSRVEQRECLLELSVHRFESGGLPSDDSLPVRHSVLSGEGKALTKRIQGPGRIGLGEGAPVPGERPGDPVGVAVGAGSGHGVLGYRHGLRRPPNGRQS